MTIRELLEYLDGNGLVVTDDERIDKALCEGGWTQDTELNLIKAENKE